MRRSGGRGRAGRQSGAVGGEQPGAPAGRGRPRGALARVGRRLGARGAARLRLQGPARRAALPGDHPLRGERQVLPRAGQRRLAPPALLREAVLPGAPPEDHEPVRLQAEPLPPVRRPLAAALRAGVQHAASHGARGGAGRGRGGDARGPAARPAAPRARPRAPTPAAARRPPHALPLPRARARRLGLGLRRGGVRAPHRLGFRAEPQQPVGAGSAQQQRAMRGRRLGAGGRQPGAAPGRGPEPGGQLGGQLGGPRGARRGRAGQLHAHPGGVQLVGGARAPPRPPVSGCEPDRVPQTVILLVWNSP